MPLKNIPSLLFLLSVGAVLSNTSGQKANHTGLFAQAGHTGAQKSELCRNLISSEVV